MTIVELLKEKGLSRYSLSKTSGVPWATLSDICSGKTNLSRCHAQTLLRLAKALGLSIEEILLLNTEGSTKQGKPRDRTYLECDLSPHLTKAIGDYVQGEKDNASYMDCLWGELYGSVNSDLWSNCITEEQAQYIRAKYLYGKEELDD